MISLSLHHLIRVSHDKADVHHTEVEDTGLNKHTHTHTHTHTPGGHASHGSGEHGSTQAGQAQGARAHQDQTTCFSAPPNLTHTPQHILSHSHQTRLLSSLHTQALSLSHTHTRVCVCLCVCVCVSVSVCVDACVCVCLEWVLQLARLLRLCDHVLVPPRASAPRVSAWLASSYGLAHELLHRASRGLSSQHSTARSAWHTA